MFKIRTIETIGISSVKELVNNFDFGVAITKGDIDYMITLSYLDPISKERSSFGEFNLTSEKVNEIISMSGVFEDNIKVMVRNSPDIVKKLF